MPITKWYRPSTSNVFTGFVSSIQNAISNNIDIASSEPYSSDYLAIYAFNWTSANLWASKSGINAWISFSFKSKPFYITHYQLQQRTDIESNFFSSWKFEGSKDGVSWSILDKRDEPEEFIYKGKSKIFDCKKGSFKYFKLTSSSTICVTLSLSKW